MNISGPTLEKLLHGIIAYRGVLHIVERRGHARDVVEALLDRDVRDRGFFEQQASLDELALQLTTPVRDVSVTRDEEHNTWSLSIDDRTSGYSRLDQVGHDFVTSGEYRTLAASYAEIKTVVRAMRAGPLDVRTVTTGKPMDDEVDEPDAEDAGDEVDAAPPPVAVAATARKADAGPMQMRSVDQFVEHFIALGRKGVAINRYKGLGEMNPDTLWTTTMNPEIRTLLQMRAEDHTEADQMFTTLMGDQVEPRRKFIEDHALDARNLDI